MAVSLGDAELLVYSEMLVEYAEAALLEYVDAVIEVMTDAVLVE